MALQSLESSDTKRIWNESLKFRERLRLETQIYESLAQTAI